MTGEGRVTPVADRRPSGTPVSLPSSAPRPAVTSGLKRPAGVGDGDRVSLSNFNESAGPRSGPQSTPFVHNKCNVYSGTSVPCHGRLPSPNKPFTGRPSADHDSGTPETD